MVEQQASHGLGLGRYLVTCKHHHTVVQSSLCRPEHLVCHLSHIPPRAWSPQIPRPSLFQPFMLSACVFRVAWPDPPEPLEWTPPRYRVTLEGLGKGSEAKAARTVLGWSSSHSRVCLSHVGSPKAAALPTIPRCAVLPSPWWG